MQAPDGLMVSSTSAIASKPKPRFSPSRGFLDGLNFAGSLNVNGLNLTGTFTETIGEIASAIPSFQSLNGVLDLYDNGLASAPAFGTDPSGTSASSLSGDTIGFLTLSLFVPGGYASGSQIIGSMTFAGTTFAQLGLLQGTYIYNLANGLDNITLNIPSDVPEPSTLGLIGLGLLGLGVMRRRHRNN